MCLGIWHRNGIHIKGPFGKRKSSCWCEHCWACVLCLCPMGILRSFQTLLAPAPQTYCTSPSCVLEFPASHSHSQPQTSLFHTGLCPFHLVPQPRASTELRFALGSRELSVFASLAGNTPSIVITCQALSLGTVQDWGRGPYVLLWGVCWVV